MIKPKAKVIGEDGNIFNLISICATALTKVNQRDKVKEMTDKVFKSSSYNEALAILSEYCELI